MAATDTLDRNPSNNNNFLVVFTPHITELAEPPIEYFARSVNLPGWSMPGPWACTSFSTAFSGP